MWYDASKLEFVETSDNTAFIRNQQKQASSNNTNNYKDYKFKMDVYFYFATTEGNSEDKTYTTKINIQAQTPPSFYTMPLFGENGSLNYLDKKRGELYRTLTDDCNKKIQALDTKLTQSINKNTGDIREYTENIEANIETIEKRLDALGFNGGNIIIGIDYNNGKSHELGYVAKMGPIIYGFLHFPKSLNTNATEIDVEQVLSGKGAELIDKYPPGKDIGFYYKQSSLADVFGHITAEGKITLDDGGDLNATGKILIIADLAAEENKNLVLSARNIPSVKLILPSNINVKDIVDADTIIATEAAINSITERLAK
jgi:hypothetical protein